MQLVVQLSLMTYLLGQEVSRIVVDEEMIQERRSIPDDFGRMGTASLKYAPRKLAT